MRLIICILKWLSREFLLVTYNVLIDAFCKKRRMKEANNVLGVMLKACVKPDIITLG